jgi:hypothetical protein
MKRHLVLLGAVLFASAFIGSDALARGAGGGGRGSGGGGHSSGGGGVVIPMAEAQEPIEWLTDYEEACKQAAEGKRAILILFTAEQVERIGAPCSFTANVVRKAVRDSKVVALKLSPPVMADAARPSAAEVRLQQEAFKKARERFEALARRLGVEAMPSVVYAAPDAARLSMQSAPADPDIIAALARVPDLVRVHEEAARREGAKPDPVAARGDPGQPPAAKPPETKPTPPAAKPGQGVDDF